jgi:hypothetical protein
MRRKNSTTGRAPLGFVLTFNNEEFSTLKVNRPGPSGTLGGLGKHENRLIDLTDPNTLHCPLDPVDFTRSVMYCLNYGGGGPNGRIRAACIPALRRIGIALTPVTA